MSKIKIVSIAILMSATPTIAADMYIPTRPLPIISEAGFNWTGAYIGAAIGGQGVRVHTPAEVTIEGTAVVGGVFAGYNWQNDNFVYGAEIDAEYSGFDQNRECGNPLWTCNAHLKGQGSLRARLGYAVDSLLFYGTAGVAVGDVGGSTTDPGGVVFADSHVRFGWTVGAGIEAAFNKNWFGRVEYRYTDFGKRDMMFDIPYTDVEARSHAVRVGIGYKF